MVVYIEKRTTYRCRRGSANESYKLGQMDENWIPKPLDYPHMLGIKFGCDELTSNPKKWK